MLAQTGAPGQVLPALLEAIGEGLSWEVGAVWMPSGERATEMRCEAFWHRPGRPAEAFEAVAQRIAPAPAGGLPGCVWSGGAPRWVEDVTVDADARRAEAAAGDGLRTCILLPVVAGAEVVGVIEFLSHDIRLRDHAQLKLLDTLSAPIAEFLVRKRVDEQLAPPGAP